MNFSRKPRQFFLLFLSVVLLASCAEKQQKPGEKLVRKWQFESIVNDSGKYVRAISAGDEMALTADNKFNYSINKPGINASGNWVLQNDTLVYEYDPQPGETAVDSSVYKVENGETKIIYFSNGKKLAETKGNGLSPNRLTRKYKIAVLNDSTLVLKENDITYNFKYQNQKTVISGFSWTGFFNGLIGILGLTLIAFTLSSNKRKINWPQVTKALLLQFLFAFCVLRVPAFREVFSAIASVFVTVLEFTRAGSTFLFGGLVDNINSFGFIFVFQVLPTIIFFSALTSALFYLNILQWIVYGFAWVMNRLMKLSGAESLSGAANIFLGQTEAPLLVKPYIGNMTRSEILALMASGMASISGGVMAAYIGFLGGPDPEQQRLFATHLLSASIMTAPGAFFAAKMLLPETEEFNKDLKITKEKIGSNLLDAIANGTTQGLKLAVNVAAMLLVFIAFMAMLNYVMLNGIGVWTGLNEKIVASSAGRYSGLTLQYLLGYIFAPIAWLIGIRGGDVSLVGQLLGQKVILNEFVAYVEFGSLKSAGSFVFDKSVIITTYALCGFANFSSIGIQLGGIGTLAPTKRAVLAELGVKALIAGTIANLMSGTIAGMLI